MVDPGLCLTTMQLRSGIDTVSPALSIRPGIVWMFIELNWVTISSFVTDDPETSLIHISQCQHWEECTITNISLLMQSAFLKSFNRS